MKKKIILGFLVLAVLLFFIASSWALDWQRARQQYYGRPEQDAERITVPSQTVSTYPSMIKFIFSPAVSDLPILIYMEKPPAKASTKAEDSTTKSNTSLKRTR